MKVLKTVNLKGFGKKHQGKVRDYYMLDDRVILVTTDRISSFDRVLGCIQNKGQVLNELASFWFDKTEDIVPNHKISVPDPNVLIAKKCKGYPVEMVVRAYITGVTKTSLWFNYSQGDREIYGLKFPDGLKKNQKLPEPIITPTTRGTGPGGHDEKITREEILERGIVPKDVYKKMEKASLSLFKRGTEICEKAGLILVDTKYEFGDCNGKLNLIDEVHTPDSSRFWIAKSYKEMLAKGQEPKNFDKEFFRLWYAKRDYRGDGKPPKMPDAYRDKVGKRYQVIYEKLTGKKFKHPKRNIGERIKGNMRFYLDEVVIIAGSEKDKKFVRTIEEVLAEQSIGYRSFYASAHKQPKKLLGLLDRYKKYGRKFVFITVAGRSNALSGFVAANSRFPVVACPPFKDKTDYLVNIHSTLQMPSNVPVMTVIDPGNAVLAAKRILANQSDG